MRDRALLLVGFAAPSAARSWFRLTSPTPGSSRVMAWSFSCAAQVTDQEGHRGRKVGLPFGSNPITCPGKGACADWLERGGIVRRAAFPTRIDRHGNVKPQRLTDQSVALITVGRSAHAAGLDAGNYAGHSLRSGLATAAAMA